MDNGFNKRHPDFAAIENHIRRAHAERSAAIGSWLAGAIVDAANATRALFSRAPAKPAPHARLVARTSAR